VLSSMSFVIHEFALYYPNVSSGEVVICADDVVHRIRNVLRMKVQESLVLFDCHNHASAVVKSIDARRVVVVVDALLANKVYEPYVQVALGLLKRDALEQAIGELVAVGVNDIVLYESEKVHRKWGGQKELSRLQRVIISAAEQSKNFSYPLLKEPVHLTHVLSFDGHRIFFDVDGVSFVQKVCSFTKDDALQLVIGPEGDLTEHEKEVLRENGYTTCRLTPTVLRSYQAASLAAGIVRSV
jgi:16S rRNA (uracil1498-N3)-methyltransferase